MLPSVFVTGVTGFVGGDALTEIYKSHPDWTYRFLVRSIEKGRAVLAAFPGSEIVVGSLDALDLLRKEAARADLVLHFASSDLDASVQALIDGIGEHQTSRPGFLIHVSGTGLLVHEEVLAQDFGKANGMVYDDVADIEQLLAFPDAAMHRSVEKLVQHTSSNIYRMIISPAAIVGTGRGPINNSWYHLAGPHRYFPSARQWLSSW